MSDTTVEMGITDYLHEIELWRERLLGWQRRLPESEAAAASHTVERLLQLGEQATAHCRLIRQQLGFDEGLEEVLSDREAVESVETELGLTIWQIMREEERLLSGAPPRSQPLPTGLPRVRLRVAREPDLR